MTGIPGGEIFRVQRQAQVGYITPTTDNFPPSSISTKFREFSFNIFGIGFLSHYNKLLAGPYLTKSWSDLQKQWMFGRLSATVLSQHDATICVNGEWKRGEKEDEDTKPRVYGLSMTI